MSTARSNQGDHGRLQPLIEFAQSEGWHVVRTPGGHLKFTKPGCAPIYTRSATTNNQAELNAGRQLRHAVGQASQAASDSCATTASKRPKEARRA